MSGNVLSDTVTERRYGPSWLRDERRRRLERQCPKNAAEELHTVEIISPFRCFTHFNPTLTDIYCSREICCRKSLYMITVCTCFTMYGQPWWRFALFESFLVVCANATVILQLLLMKYCCAACSCVRETQILRDVFTAGDESRETDETTWSHLAEDKREVLKSYLSKRSASRLVKLWPDVDVELWLSSCRSQLSDTRLECTAYVASELTDKILFGIVIVIF